MDSWQTRYVIYCAETLTVFLGQKRERPELSILEDSAGYVTLDNI